MSPRLVPVDIKDPNFFMSALVASLASLSCAVLLLAVPDFSVFFGVFFIFGDGYEIRP
jgi:hypothetical protein